jgi:hypothetical protein
MKKISKKRLNQIENKIIKLLDTKVSICSVIWIIIVLILFSLLFNKKPSYYYIDTNNNSGHSNKCYYNGNTRQIECLVPIKVQQYYKV